MYTDGRQGRGFFFFLRQPIDLMSSTNAVRCVIPLFLPPPPLFDALRLLASILYFYKDNDEKMQKKNTRNDKQSNRTENERPRVPMNTLCTHACLECFSSGVEILYRFLHRSRPPPFQKCEFGNYRHWEWNEFVMERGGEEEEIRGGSAGTGHVRLRPPGLRRRGRVASGCRVWPAS